MRLVSALQRGLVDLSHVEWLVVDEADRLFENGFETQVGCCLLPSIFWITPDDAGQIDEIIAACTSPERRIALFSATMVGSVRLLGLLMSQLTMFAFGTASTRGGAGTNCLERLHTACLAASGFH
jgi:hypothetical protein